MNISTFVVIFILLIYFILFLILISGEDTESYYNNDHGRYMIRNRKLLTKDFWKCALWPFIFLVNVIKILFHVIHYVFALLLLGFGVHYINSFRYRQIKKKLTEGL